MRRNIKHIFFCFVLSVSVPAVADTLHDVDSLLTVFQGSSLSKRTDIARQLIPIYNSDAIFFADTLSFSHSFSSEERDLMVWFGSVRYFVTKSYYAEALRCSEHALPLAQKLDEQDMYATILSDRCYCWYKTSKYEDAIVECQQAIVYSEQTQNDMQLSRAYLYLSMVNFARMNYDQAILMVNKSIEVNRRLGKNMQSHNCYGVACEIYCGARRYDEAVEYGQKAVVEARETNNQSAIANHMTQLSYVFDRMGKYQEGLDMANEAIAIVESIESLDRNQLAISLEMKSWNLLDLGRNEESVVVLNQAIELERQIGNAVAVYHDYKTLCEALDPIDKERTLEAMKIYTKIGDSLHLVQLNEVQSRVNAELRVNDLEQQNMYNRKMNIIIFVASMLVVLLLVFAIVMLSWALYQRKRTARTMQKLADVREEFFTNITHEFRTPLTVILGLSSEIEKSTDDSDVSSMAQKIRHQGRSLLLMINQMLEISKVRSALGEQRKQQGNIVAYIEMVIERHQVLARQKNIVFNYDLPDHAIEAVFVADYVEKIVSNLLSNAIKYTPEGGMVSADISQTDTGLLIKVSDTGVGISLENQYRIFEPFVRANEGVEGTGVGLALVRQMVEALHGEIMVESEIGKGSVFTISMPLEIVEESSKSDSVQLVESEAVEGKQSLLIVEDNADVASLIARQLADRFVLSFASNGEEGILRAQQSLPDVVITDLMMPKVDGLQLCQALRGDVRTSHIPIIVITAKANDESRIELLRSGADAYLTKPFNSEELNALLDNLLRTRGVLQREYSADQPQETEKSHIVPSGQTIAPFVESSNNFMKAFDELIDRSIANNESCDIEKLASELCLTTSTLRRKVIAVVGIPPKKYVINYKLEKARIMMINNPEYTVNYIADKFGFYDVSHFVKMFRQRYGQNPTAETRAHE